MTVWPGGESGGGEGGGEGGGGDGDGGGGDGGGGDGGGGGGGDGEGTHAVTSTEPKLAPSRSQLPPASCPRKMQTLPELWNVNELQG